MLIAFGNILDIIPWKNYREVVNIVYTMKISLLKNGAILLKEISKKRNKMILIITEEQDVSTIETLNWLNYYQKEFVIINENTSVKLVSYTIAENNTDFTLAIDGKIVKLSEISAHWHRKAQINNSFYTDFSEIPTQNSTYMLLKNFLHMEENSVLNHIYYLLKRKKSIGGYKNCDVNKLNCLYQATCIGLNVPKTLIADSKNEVVYFFPNQNVITKSIQHLPLIDSEEHLITSYTEKIEISQLPDTFQMSLFQELIEKKYEIRVFYINQKIYSLAILSQKDEQTKIDFRKYNYSKPNRVMPFQMPKVLEMKICKLMQVLNLNTGSLDFIYSIENEFIFLEINPVGQYANVSYHGNYYLDKIIAEELI
jgi:ATP-GRASP peptide maturase of grasp-with-spasm system